MKKPEVKKSQGQTDKRILGLSFKDFEEEFGWKPKDKIEQRFFATHGERLSEQTDPKIRKGAEISDKARKNAAKRRAEMEAKQ